MPRVMIGGYHGCGIDYAPKSPETRQFEEENGLTEQFDPMLFCASHNPHNPSERDIENGLSMRGSLHMPINWPEPEE